MKKYFEIGENHIKGVAVVVSAPDTWNVRFDCNAAVSTRIFERISTVTKMIGANVIPKTGGKHGWYMCCRSPGNAQQMRTRGDLIQSLFHQSFITSAADIGHSTLNGILSIDSIAESMVGKNHWICLLVEPGHFVETVELFCPKCITDAHIKEPVSPLSLGQIFFNSEGQMQLIFDRAKKLIREDEVRK